MFYKKDEGVRGNWIKGSELESGTKCKLVSETVPRESKWTNEDGTKKMQDVSRVRLQGGTEDLNINLNRPTINALVDAFGEDSKNWQGKVLTISVEKTRIAGKSVYPIYLVPEGYRLVDDEGGYAVIVKEGQEPEKQDALPDFDENKGVNVALDAEVPF